MLTNISYFQALPSQGQALQQYILSPGYSTLSSSSLSTIPSLGVSLSPALSTLPGVGLPLGPSLSSYSNGLSFQTVSPKYITTGLPTSQVITQPGLPALTIAPPPAGSCSPNPPSTKEGMDSEVLNNLAIALQLLIVSNLLNSPLPESFDDFKSVESLPPTQGQYSVSYAPASLPQPLPTAQSSPAYYQLPSPPPGQQATYYQLPPSNAPPAVIQNPTQYYPSYESSPTVSYSPPTVMPNANFVGSSSYTDGSNVLTAFSGPCTSSAAAPARPPRASLALMSPYEAIAPTSPYSDPILSSPYGSIITSNRDFKSPYSTFDTGRDYYGSDFSY